MIDWIFPSFCRECSVFISRGAVFCDFCKKNIKPAPSTMISVRGISIPVFAFSRYEGSVKKLVLRKKRTLFQMSGDMVASRQLGQLLCDLSVVHEAHFDYIVAIPLYWMRYLWRGFNQSYEMARVISKRIGVPVICPLRRVRHTPFQSALSGKQRDANVGGVFVVKDGFDLRDKSILIIDDLFTTGATLKNFVEPLIACGIKKVAAAVACRV